MHGLNMLAIVIVIIACAVGWILSPQQEEIKMMDITLQEEINMMDITGKEITEQDISTLTLPGGTIFKGTFRNGGLHGYGTSTTTEGYSYVGLWKEGRQHDYGIETMPDGSVYTGMFMDGQRHGLGSLVPAPKTGFWSLGKFVKAEPK